MLVGLLRFDPMRRMKPSAAMKMTYCATGPWVELPPPTRAPKKEPVTRDLITSDSRRLTTALYREGIYSIVKDHFAPNAKDPSQQSSRSSGPSRRSSAPQSARRDAYRSNGGEYRSHEKRIDENDIKGSHGYGHASSYYGSNGHGGETGVRPHGRE